MFEIMNSIWFRIYAFPILSVLNGIFRFVYLKPYPFVDFIVLIQSFTNIRYYNRKIKNKMNYTYKYTYLQLF